MARTALSGQIGERRLPAFPKLPTIPGSDRINYGKYCEDNMERIEKKLAFKKMERRIINLTFASDYYFADGEFSHIRFWIDQIIKTLHDIANNLRMPRLHMPTRTDFRDLQVGNALSLFKIIRLDDALTYLIDLNIPLSAVLKQGGTQDGIADGSIIHSIRYVSPDTAKVLRETRGITAATLSNRIRSFDKTIPTDKFWGYLEEGPRRGKAKRRWQYRITDALADLAIRALRLSDVTGEVELPLDIDLLFPLNPLLGSGNGKYTCALELQRGNVLAVPAIAADNSASE